MNTNWAYGLAMLLVISPVVLADTDTPVTASLLGLEIFDDQFPKEAFDFSPFNAEPGTTAYLQLTSPDKSVIEVDNDASKIETFQDNSSTDLLTPPATQPKDVPIAGQPSLAWTRLPRSAKTANSQW